MVYPIGLDLTLTIWESDIFLNLKDIWSPVASLEIYRDIYNWTGIIEVEFVLTLFAFIQLELNQTPIYEKPLMVGWYILSESDQEHLPWGSNISLERDYDSVVLSSSDSKVEIIVLIL